MALSPDAGPPSLPVSLRLAGRACLLVGGGTVALGRARALVAARARLTVVALHVVAEFASLDCVVERRAYLPGEAAGYLLVIAATGDPVVNGLVFADAERAGVLVNAVDDLEHSNTTFPAVFREGPVSVAVSSDATSPALTRYLRDEIAATYIGEVGFLAATVGEVRTQLRATGRSSEGRPWQTLITELRRLRADAGEEEARDYARRWLEGELERT